MILLLVLVIIAMATGAFVSGLGQHRQTQKLIDAQTALLIKTIDKKKNNA